MDFKEYHAQALSTMINRSQGHDVTSNSFVRMVLGLVGESGEFADKIKKIYRDDEGELSDEKRDLLLKELGDVLWYIAALADHLDSDLETVAKQNIEKLASRKKRDTLGGSGDTR